MKKILLLSIFIISFSCSNKKKIKQVAEISCGQCQFELDSQNGCDLAIRIDNKAYFVDGFNIDDFGDAHNKQTGFCEVVRKANIQGKIENNKFLASSIKMID
ncbi:DUF6370 family protein [Polaribacter ponticola]|uniref:DUF6370 family protein n=1 Tax=Polaribacter ponticola TaxID=2978475 RepID=A0ABT5SB77_9FLAO|nr:DUF6370 family protein [Polaribacter sp. MSW5]MDD7915369.1 DUF6370 family protein [Polaribacter sp. MSW5]